jgi:hypothetical protein
MPNTDTQPTSVFTTQVFWSTVLAAIATVWQQAGWNADWLGKFNTVLPLLLQILGGIGILHGHVSAPARTVSMRFPGAKLILMFMLPLMLIGLTGCPKPVNPPTPIPATQPTLAQEQQAINTIQTAVTLAHDAYLFYAISNPNPVQQAIELKAYAAAEAAIATAQAHINAGDVVSLPGLLADAQAAFQAFLTTAQPGTKALHTRAMKG